MIPSLQPHRPKPPQQPPQPRVTHQQTRAAHSIPSTPHQAPSTSSSATPTSRPRTQVEAMPPYPLQPHPFAPPRNLYDSALRHPVFFTEQLKKPPFPIPVAAATGWNPVAAGYIWEQPRADADVVGKTKL